MACSGANFTFTETTQTIIKQKRSRDWHISSPCTFLPLHIYKSFPNQSLFSLFPGCVSNSLSPKRHPQKRRGCTSKAKRTEYWVTYNTKEPQTKLPLPSSPTMPYFLTQPFNIPSFSFSSPIWRTIHAPLSSVLPLHTSALCRIPESQ